MLVIDATTGQNGLQQAREFDRALHLNALIVTKLDGSAKGGISLAISHELGLPIIKCGVGEAIEDLRAFSPEQFVRALIGDFEETDLQEGSDLPDDRSAGSSLRPEETPTASSEEPARALSWAEFVELDDARKAEEAAKPKKHFWDKW